MKITGVSISLKPTQQVREQLKINVDKRYCNNKHLIQMITTLLKEKYDIDDNIDIIINSHLPDAYDSSNIYLDIVLGNQVKVDIMPVIEKIKLTIKRF